MYIIAIPCVWHNFGNTMHSSTPVWKVQILTLHHIYTHIQCGPHMQLQVPHRKRSIIQIVTFAITGHTVGKMKSKRNVLVRVTRLLPQSNNTQDPLSHLVLSETGHPSSEGCQVGYYLWEVASISHLPEEKVDHLLPDQEQLRLLWWSAEEEEEEVGCQCICKSCGMHWPHFWKEPGKEALLIYSKCYTHTFMQPTTHLGLICEHHWITLRAMPNSWSRLVLRGTVCSR